MQKNNEGKKFTAFPIQKADGCGGIRAIITSTGLNVYFIYSFTGSVLYACIFKCIPG